MPKKCFDAADIYLFEVNNENTSTMCEICLTLTVKTPERPHCRRSCLFTVKFEQIFTNCTGFSTVGFEQVNNGSKVHKKWYEDLCEFS